MCMCVYAMHLSTWLRQFANIMKVMITVVMPTVFSVGLIIYMLLNYK